MRHFLSRRQVGHQFTRDSQTMGHDAGDIDGVVGDALDGLGDLQHRRHRLGITGVSHRQDAHGTHVVHQATHGNFKFGHLLGHLGIAEVERGIGQVHHEFGGVFCLRQHGAQVAGSVIHVVFHP